MFVELTRQRLVMVTLGLLVVLFPATYVTGRLLQRVTPAGRRRLGWASWASSRATPRCWWPPARSAVPYFQFEPTAGGSPAVTLVETRMSHQVAATASAGRSGAAGADHLMGSILVFSLVFFFGRRSLATWHARARSCPKLTRSPRWEGWKALPQLGPGQVTTCRAGGVSLNDDINTGWPADHIRFRGHLPQVIEWRWLLRRRCQRKCKPA